MPEISFQMISQSLGNHRYWWWFRAFFNTTSPTQRRRFIWAQLSRTKTNVKQLLKQFKLVILAEMTGFSPGIRVSPPRLANPPGKRILGNTNGSLPCFTWVVCWRAALVWSRMLERAVLDEERRYSSAGGENPGARWLGWELSSPPASRESPVRKTHRNFMLNFTRNPLKEAPIKSPHPWVSAVIWHAGWRTWTIRRRRIHL